FCRADPSLARGAAAERQGTRVGRDARQRRRRHRQLRLWPRAAADEGLGRRCAARDRRVGHRAPPEGIERLMTTRWMALVFGALALGSTSAQAQQAAVPDMFLHGVPAGTATATTIQLSLADAISRGLDHNLAIVLQQSRSSNSEGQRERDLSALL